jgi:hypothetical protein
MDINRCTIKDYIMDNNGREICTMKENIKGSTSAGMLINRQRL